MVDQPGAALRVPLELRRGVVELMLVQCPISRTYSHVHVESLTVSP